MAQSTPSTQHSAASSITDGSLAKDLTACTITPTNPIQIVQIQHRLHVLTTWFGSWQNAQTALVGKTVMEIGCGQGDMTTALAHLVSGSNFTTMIGKEKGKVIAVDPAPLDYGSPYNLGDSQAAISRSRLGAYIQWVQSDPVDFLASYAGEKIDYIVLAHSPFYLPSVEYFGKMLEACRSAGTKLCLAEWGMEYTSPKAEAHVLAVKVQMEHRIADANVRTVLTPGETKALAEKCGWGLEREGWIREPDMQDGGWEVGGVRDELKMEDMSETARRYRIQMDEAVKRNGEPVQSMDVWTGVFSARV